MPLARFALYEQGVEIYLAPTADDSEDWHASLRHIARESRAFVLSSCSFQRASSYPDDVPLADGNELIDRGGSAILAPDGSYLAGPLWDEEGILYADLDPSLPPRRAAAIRPGRATTIDPTCSRSPSTGPHDVGHGGRRGRVRRLDGARARAPRPRRDARRAVHARHGRARAPAATRGCSRAAHGDVEWYTASRPARAHALARAAGRDRHAASGSRSGSRGSRSASDGFEALEPRDARSGSASRANGCRRTTRATSIRRSASTICTACCTSPTGRAARAARDAAARRGRRAARRPLRDRRSRARGRRRGPTSSSGPAARGCRSSSPSTSTSISRRDVFFFGADGSWQRHAGLLRLRRAVLRARRASAGLGAKVAPDVPGDEIDPDRLDRAAARRRSSSGRASTPRGASRRSPTRRSSARASASTS